eukprot:CAMPEP_0184664746 /NCGR_PEP_ID=MMETSP0308-20130426/54216_1 /TAXON_ID=38269 /ORGANISM="Gloeochaete witrockiana, Strain SAG 46.84" /LENGTH=342 /DNA_ID=CAMNT_0027108333 /DNA_START=127 /DNA_END=1155 /DNA_ORIENTATION=-
MCNTLRLLYASTRYVEAEPTEASEKHLLFIVLEAMWPHLTTLAATFADDNIKTDFVEALCQFLDGVLQAGRSKDHLFLFPIFPHLLSLLLSSFSRSLEPAVLDTVANAVSVFGPVVEAKAGRDLAARAEAWKDLTRALEALSTIVFGIMKTDIAARPDILKAYFSLSSQVIKSAPGALMSSPLLPTIIEAALATLNIPSHPKDAIRSSISFMAELCNGTLSGSSVYQQPCSIILHQYGERITSALLSAVMGALPRSLAPNVGEGLFSLITLLPSEFCQWASQHMHTVFSMGPPQFLKVTRQDCERFLKEMMSARNKKQFQTKVAEFAGRCLYPQSIAPAMAS